MADLPVTQQPFFSETMEKVATTDLGAPETFNPRYQVLLDNDNYLKKEAERTQRTVEVSLPASGWSAAVPYSQRAAVPGVKGTDNPHLALCTTKALSSAETKLRIKYTSMITAGTSEDGYMTFYCGVKKPAGDFVVKLEGVSVNG